AAAVERHVQSCDACAEKRKAFVDLRADIRAHAPYYTAPERLRRRVTPKRETVRGWRPSAALAGAAMGCAATVLVFFLGNAAIDRFESSSMSRQTVASH